MKDDPRDFIVKYNIKENLKMFREYNHLTQSQIADVLRVERSTYTSWESGRTMPKPAQLSKLSEIFKCTIDFLVKNDPHYFKPSDFRLEAPAADYNGRRKDTLFLHLEDDEQTLLLKYRLLSEEDKLELEQFFNNHSHNDEDDNDE